MGSLVILYCQTFCYAYICLNWWWFANVTNECWHLNWLLTVQCSALGYYIGCANFKCKIILLWIEFSWQHRNRPWILTNIFDLLASMEKTSDDIIPCFNRYSSNNTWKLDTLNTFSQRPLLRSCFQLVVMCRM